MGNVNSYSNGPGVAALAVPRSGKNMLPAGKSCATDAARTGSDARTRVMRTKSN